MKSNLQNIHPIVFLLVATTFEVSGDAIMRKSIYDHAGKGRIVLCVLGAILLFGYGFFLNLAPVEFGKIVGLYIATLFIVGQIITYLTFKTLPTLPIVIGGSLIVMGGLTITFWNSKP